LEPYQTQGCAFGVCANSLSIENLGWSTLNFIETLEASKLTRKQSTLEKSRVSTFSPAVDIVILGGLFSWHNLSVVDVKR
jgi:hypothetical protein